MALSILSPDSLDLTQDFAGIHLGGTGSANQLDDYEEGTWTPVANGSTTGTGTYNSQHGSYVKIGSLVTVNFDYSLNTHTGSGFYRLNGLPFASTSTTGIESIGSVMINLFNTSSALGTVVLYLGGNSTSLRLYVSYDNAAWTQESLDAAHSLIGTISYRTDA